MISAILSILAGVITLYTTLCFIYIVMTWIPGLRFTRFGHFIASCCEPYLNFFSRLGFLHIGHVDFSPIISLGLLSLASSILGGIQSTGRIWFGGILATVIQMLWSIISSILSIFFLLVVIRWIVLLIKRGQIPFNSAWEPIDQFLNRFSYKITSTFIKKAFSYQTSLLVTWITFGLILLAGSFLFRVLAVLCYQLPF